MYDKICTKAEKLVQTGEDIEREYGIPIINKRVSVTPIAIMAGISGGDPVKYALALEKAARTIGVNLSAVTVPWYKRDLPPATGN